MPKSLKDKINPIWWAMNEDDPHPPKNYMRDYKSWVRYLCWYIRNPFHNFFWYIIGIHDRDDSFMFYWRYYGNLWRPVSGWNVSVIQWKWLYFPFVSWKSERIRFYVGWRPRWGAFGFKFLVKL